MPEVSQLQTHLCTIEEPVMDEDGDTVNEPCGQPAVALYAWPWGENGACCQRHQFILNQKSQHLSQHLALSPLHVPAPALNRDERTNMHAQILALQDECAELKRQGATMYNDNVALQAEGRRLLARSNELDRKIAALTEQHGQTRQNLDEVLAERDELRAENQRLKLLVSAPAPALAGAQPPPVNTTLGTGGNQPPPNTTAGR